MTLRCGLVRSFHVPLFEIAHGVEDHADFVEADDFRAGIANEKQQRAVAERAGAKSGNPIGDIRDRGREHFGGRLGVVDELNRARLGSGLSGHGGLPCGALPSNWATHTPGRRGWQ